VYLFLNLGV